MNKWLPAAVALAVCSVGAAGYHQLKKISVPGDYGWDYASADTEGRRLYVGHDKEVVVIDLDTDAIVGSIGGGADMHGAAVAREFGRGFISETNPGSVVIFDLKTLAKIAEVPFGRDPNLVLV
jgi:DNA-binding beta-propeller fold protein YncE